MCTSLYELNIYEINAFFVKSHVYSKYALLSKTKLFAHLRFRTQFFTQKNMNWLRFYSEYLSKKLVGGGSDQDSNSTSTSCVETLHNFFVTIALTIYMTKIMVIYLGGLCSWHRLEIVSDLPWQLYAWGACLSQIQVDFQCVFSWDDQGKDGLWFAWKPSSKCDLNHLSIVKAAWTAKDFDIAVLNNNKNIRK